MRLRIERPTALAPERLYAWWTDFREGADDHAFLGAAAPHVGRRILDRGEGWLLVEDVGRFLGMPLVEHYKVFLKPDRREVALHGANNYARFSARYRFEPGVALCEATVAPVGILALLDVPLRPLVRSFLRKDLDGHVADAERDLAG